MTNFFFHADLGKNGPKVCVKLCNYYFWNFLEHVISYRGLVGQSPGISVLSPMVACLHIFHVRQLMDDL